MNQEIQAPEYAAKQMGLLANPAIVATNAVHANSISELSQIYEETVNICQLDHFVTLPAQVFSQRLLKEKSFSSFTQQISSPEEVYDFRLTHFALLPGYDVWLNCLYQLCDIFSCLFEAKNMGLRIQKLNKAMCPKFHVDHLAVRMVLTFAGQGTQWLPNAAADRSRLGMGSAGLDDTSSGIARCVERIQTAPAGALLLLKGEGWAGNEGNGIIHRSPAASEQSPRLVVTLDLLEA